jgi:tetratricopeptide (TPR) repeat protein
VIQRNAIKSWTLLSPKPEIILMGSDAGVAEYAAELGLRHIAEVRKNEFGTPLVSDIFSRAQEAAANDVLMYINSDIILVDDFQVALNTVRGRFDEFLMVGQRWNVDIDVEINFDALDWQEQLRKLAYGQGTLFGVAGIDYFAFSRGVWPAIPDFGIGRFAWDNWLVWKPTAEGKVVVDATEVVMAIHQDHEYVPSPSKLKEEALNRSLSEDGQSFGFTSYTVWKCTPAGIAMRHPCEFFNNSNWAGGIAYVEKALPQDPATIEKWCRHAIACMTPEVLKILADSANVLLAKQPYHGGAAMVKKCIMEKARSIGGIMLRGGAEYLQKGHVEEAIKWFDVMAGFEVPNLNYARAVAFSQLGKYGSAMQACLDELKLQPGQDGAKTLLAQIDAEFKKEANELCVRGLSKMQSGDFVAALTDFEAAAIRCFAESLPNLNYAKAVALSRLGKYGSARQACLEELKFQPGHAGAAEMLEKLNRAIDEYNASKEKGGSETKIGAANTIKEVELKILPLEQSEISCSSTMLRTGK